MNTINHQPPTINRFAWLIATWFGSGLSPFASGTAGSLAALPFAYAMQITLGNFALFIAAIFIFLIGWWASNEYLRHNAGDADPGEIVVDEVAGQWLLLSVLVPTWQAYLLGFLVFRLFDIVKPWPISWADRSVKGGLGVMLDDILAAMYPVLIYLTLMLVGYPFGIPALLNPFMNMIGGSYVH